MAAIGYDEPGVAYDSPLYTYDGLLVVPPDFRPRHTCARVGRQWESLVGINWFAGVFHGDPQWAVALADPWVAQVQPTWEATVREAVCR